MKNGSMTDREKLCDSAAQFHIPGIDLIPAI
jgi:hypothetical protein